MHENSAYKPIAAANAVTVGKIKKQRDSGGGKRMELCETGGDSLSDDEAKEK